MQIRFFKCMLTDTESPGFDVYGNRTPLTDVLLSRGVRTETIKRQREKEEKERESKKELLMSFSEYKDSLCLLHLASLHPQHINRLLLGYLY